MGSLKDFYWKRWVKRHRCKLAGGLQSLSRRTELTLEEGVALGHVDIDSPRLAIGAHTYIRSGSHLSLVASIGRFCSMGTGVVIGQEKHTHPTDWLSSHPFQYTASPLSYRARTQMATIGHDVWVGSHAMVMEGVNVGTGAVIATRAVVAGDVPAYAIVAGVPAKVVRFRHAPDVIERLLASRWWEIEVEELKTLPLDEPETCLELLERKAPVAAQYRKISVTRKGCRAGEMMTVT
ncbi:CatB-related O-acetyltransferase [Pseudomonas sp. D2-30]|uniref:CatB-related O-acetyltransferase n=1 Tax=unclassified Pseudomonas TaxID=196821 RepID=UPI003DA82553